MVRTSLALLALTIFLTAHCGQKEKARTTESDRWNAMQQDPGMNAIARNYEAKSSPPEPAREGAPHINTVEGQWAAIADRIEGVITLTGSNMPKNATVTSRSPYVTVGAIESDASRTLVSITIDPATPAGNLELEYTAPGFPPVDFTVGYSPPQ